ncbi:RHS repeat-associated core domain-containing protein [Christiangramia marina]|uniref:RHS repeat-associated core domain-containing protein n=1 Tax=Christiangramia marina TaxID=409436 RepID=UPI003AA9AD06
MNLLYEASYRVDGTKVSSGVSYYNNMGKLTQSQQWDIASDTVWASGVYYDSYGRAVLNTLSAPVGTDFLKETNLIKDASGGDFDFIDYQFGNQLTPSAVSSQSKLGSYYSNTNSSNPYQDITDHPYSLAVYSRLRPGEALRSLGGKKVDIDGDDTYSWESGYSFKMKAGDELAAGVAFNDASYSSRVVFKTVMRSPEGFEVVKFEDGQGNLLAQARSGNESGGTTPRNSSVSMNEQGYVDIHIPKGCSGASVSGASGYSLEIFDLITEQKITTSLSSLPSGFYRIAVEDPGLVPEEDRSGFTNISVSYQENYYDYALNYYDKAGRPTSSTQPLSGLAASTNSYNSLGQLLSTSNPDKGTGNFKYRKDGQIRFSQNSKQAQVGHFSYTDYDQYARPVESGVVTNLSFATMDPDASLLGSAITEEVVKTTYDIPADLSGMMPAGCSLPAAYQQGFVNSNISMTTTQSPKTATTVYSYDILGRVTWIVQFIEGLECPKTIDYTYDPVSGQVTKVDYQQHTPGERFIHQYNYDQSGRLTTVSTSTDDVSYKQQASYTYNISGELTRTIIGDNLQGIDYVYNLEGQLKAINHPSLMVENDPGQDGTESSQVLPDLFGLGIDYHNQDYLRDNTPTPVATFSGGVNNINGNIKALRWKSDAQDTKQHLYNYQYSKESWLKEAEYGRYEEGVNAPLNLSVTNQLLSGEQENFYAQESITFGPGFTAEAGSEMTARIVAGEELYTPDPNQDYMVDNINYDANGNIVNLRRNKQTENGSNKMDDLSYSYYPGKNQLQHVADGVTETTNANDIKSQGGNNYVYNEIGQLVFNTEEDLTYTYTTSGLVETVSKPSVVVNFYYNDRGHRTRKESTISGVTTNTYYVRDVSGNVMAIYNEAGAGTTMEHPIFGNSRIGVAKRNLGQTTLTNLNYVYQLTDHLGNVRIVVQQDDSGNAMAIGKTDYYPFGMAMPGRNMEGDYRYAYQGQEKDTETGKEAFGLRLWDSRIGRWLTTDPYNQYNSPYLGMGNDPVNGIDPDGGWKTKWGQFWGWVGNGFRGQRYTSDVSTGSGKYGIALDYGGGDGSGELTGTFMATSGADLAAFNSGFADPVMAPQTTFEKIFGDNFRAGPNGFAVDKYGYELDFYPPQTGMGALGLVGGPSSYKLGKNLVSSGISRPANSAAHHIVAGLDRRAALARKLLAAENIGINSVKNGVFLPKSTKYITVKDAIPHTRIHTDLYYKELTRKLLSAGPGNRGKALDQFKQSIINGTVKY